MSSPHVCRALLPLVLATGVLTACGDRSLVAPEVPVPVPAAVVSSIVAAGISGSNDAEDLIDLLVRVLPSVGDTPVMNALTVHVRRLRERAEAGATDDVRRHAEVALKLLETIERDADGEASADLGVIRLVLENRL